MVYSRCRDKVAHPLSLSSKSLSIARL